MKRYKKLEFKSIKDGVRDEYIVDPDSVQSINDCAFLNTSAKNEPVITPNHIYTTLPAIIAGYPRILTPTNDDYQIVMSGSSVKVARRASPSVGFSALGDAPQPLDCLFQNKIFTSKYISDPVINRSVSINHGTSFTALANFPVGPDGNAVDFNYWHNGDGPAPLNQTYYALAHYFEDEENLEVYQTDDYISFNHLFSLKIDGILQRYFSFEGELFAWITPSNHQLQLIKINIDSQSFDIIYTTKNEAVLGNMWLDFFFFNNYHCALIKDGVDTLHLLIFDGLLVERKTYMVGKMMDYIHFLGVSGDKAFFLDHSLSAGGVYRFHFFDLDFALFPNFYSLVYDTYDLPHDISEWAGFTYYAMNHKTAGAVDATWCVNLPFDTSVNSYCTVDYPILSLGKLAPKQIIVRHDKLTTDQKVEIYYKIDKATSWTKLGESATVGAVAARLTFPDNLPADFIQFQLKLSRSSANLSPTGVNFDFLYLPIGLENAG